MRPAETPSSLAKSSRNPERNQIGLAGESSRIPRPGRLLPESADARGAARGFAPPIPYAARRGLVMPGRDGESRLIDRTGKLSSV